MRIALFSDIHANLAAFEKMLESLDLQKPDAVYCLGDLVGYNVWPNEIIEEIRRRGIATIAGNHDAKVNNLSVKQLEEPGRNYGYKIIEEKNKKYLATLPAHIRIEFQLNNTPLNVLLVHGSPQSKNEYLLEDKPEEEFLEIFKKANADILCFGHSHKPYHRVFNSMNENKNHFRHAINIGSVGKPKDGNPQGCYVILTLHEYSSTFIEESIDVDFIRFDYDIEKAGAAIEESPLPNEFADLLRKAY
jgi:putative phosphoesterase